MLVLFLTNYSKIVVSLYRGKQVKVIGWHVRLAYTRLTRDSFLYGRRDCNLSLVVAWWACFTARGGDHYNKPYRNALGSAAGSF